MLSVLGHDGDVPEGLGLRGLPFDSPWAMGDLSCWAMGDHSPFDYSLGSGGMNDFPPFLEQF